MLKKVINSQRKYEGIDLKELSRKARSQGQGSPKSRVSLVGALAVALASILAFAFSFALPSTVVAQLTEFDNPSVLIPVDLSGTYYRYNIVIPEFQPLRAGGQLDANSQALATRLGKNLDMTGIFQLVDPRASLEIDPRAGLTGASPFDYAPWAQIGASFVIRGGIRVSGSNIAMELKLFDVALGQQRLGKLFEGKVKDARKMINVFTNQVILSITGEPGVFGSKIIFVTGERAGRSVMMTELGSDDAEGVAASKNGPATQPTLGPGDATAWTHRNRNRSELVANGRVVHSGDTVLTPAYMPDGTLVAALSGSVSTNITVFSGRNKRPLTGGSGIDVSPTFSPDGRMAYVSTQGGGAGIYVTSASGGQGSRISPGGTSTDPSWSPKGDKIAFVYRERDICLVNPDGSGLIQLTGGQGQNFHPSFSPDGRMIVFSSNRGGRHQLYVMSVNGDRQQLLIPDYQGSQTLPTWSPVMPPS
jgi:TolB protein